MLGKRVKSIAFYATVVISLLAIFYFTLGFKKDTKKESDAAAGSPATNASQTVTTQEEMSSNDSKATEKDEAKEENTNTTNALVQDNTQKTTQAAAAVNTNQLKEAEASPQKQQSTQKPKAQNEVQKNGPAVKKDDTAIKIKKSEVTADSKFYPYILDGIPMEVIAVKASDGTIRTALNTCQVCFDSGRGYYEQVGEYLVCQNCKNRFHIDQVEEVKGGCNPVPILEENKKDDGTFITISKAFMETQKQFFSNWKKK